jgi:hypothetical protein
MIYLASLNLINIAENRPGNFNFLVLAKEPSPGVVKEF